jgi:serine/threonine protein kinase
VSARLPRQFGPYLLLKDLGEGAAGSVHLARALKLGGEPRPLVIKCLHPWLASDVDIERFRHEASIAVSVDSPHVVKVFDAGTVATTPYISMEYLPGWTVAEMLRVMIERREPIGLPAAVQIYRDGLAALHALHNAKNPENGAPLGVVHRDIAPRNLILHRDGRLVLIDLGLGRSNAQPWRTKAGAIFGTPGYMAPEQASSARMDHRADLYALTVVFFELLTLERYVPKADRAAMIAWMQAPVFRAPASLRQGVPKSLDPLMQRALAVRPEDRFASAEELLGALDASGIGGESEERATLNVPRVLFDRLEEREGEVKLLMVMGVDALDDTQLQETRIIAARPLEEAITFVPTLNYTLTIDQRPPTIAIDRSHDTIAIVPRKKPPQKMPMWPLLLAGIALVLGLSAYLVLDRRPKEVVRVPAIEEAQPRAESAELVEEKELPPAAATAKKPRGTAKGPPQTKIEPEPTLKERYDALFRDASALRKSRPELSAELDELLAIASIWSLSKDETSAARSLLELRKKLEQLAQR